MSYVCGIQMKWVLYVIDTDPGTITTIQRFGFAFREPGLFQLVSEHTWTVARAVDMVVRFRTL